MATIKIRDNTYQNVPMIEVPLDSGGGNAEFYDTSDATLDNGSRMLYPYTAYADGVKFTGNIQTKTGSDLTASGDTVTVPAGYYASQSTKAVSGGSVTAPSTISGSSASVSTGTNTITLTKTVSVTPNVTSAGYISSGTAGNSAVTLTASVTTKGATTYTPTTSDQTIASGTYLTAVQTIKGDSNLKSENIVAGKSIFNISGSAQIPVITQNQTTKVLSIS